MIASFQYAERDVEVELGEVAPGALRVALAQLLAGRKARAPSSPARSSGMSSSPGSDQ